jgi:hypothetical protein
MLTARLKIGTGEIQDTRTYGLVYLSSDNVVGAPIKGFEETSYPEQQGVNISPKTVDAAFDYKVTFFMQASSIANANERIRLFNNALFEQPLNSDVKTFKKVEFYNDYKRHKIVGYPQPISEAKDFWRDKRSQLNDIVIVEWTIRVVKPSDCDFSTVPEQ